MLFPFSTFHPGVLAPPNSQEFIYNITIIVSPTLISCLFPFHSGHEPIMFPSPESLTIFGIFKPATRTLARLKGSHGTFVFPLRVMASVRVRHQSLQNPHTPHLALVVFSQRPDRNRFSTAPSNGSFGLIHPRSPRQATNYANCCSLRRHSERTYVMSVAATQPWFLLLFLPRNWRPRASVWAFPSGILFLNSRCNMSHFGECVWRSDR